MNAAFENPARAEARAQVLAAAGFAGAVRAPMPGDASTRRYERIALNGHGAILMDAPPQAETAPCPPEASPQERARMGYNAEARLAASRVEAFVAIAAQLAALGLSGPRIHAVDAEHGFVVLEDFGDGLYFDLLGAGAAPAPLYEAAIEALAALHAHPAPTALEGHGCVWPLLGYDATALHAEAALLIDWFAPKRMGREIGPAARAEWRAAWDAAFVALAGPTVLTLRDFHSPNLMWLADRRGAQAAGILDFQDGLAGHPAYDLVSLLEDARRDVAPDFSDTMLARYLARAVPADPEAFRAAFAVLGAQRNAKIAGIFARLAHRDGKDRYLAHLPRVLRYLARDLTRPALAPVAAWFDRHLPVADWSVGP